MIQTQTRLRVADNSGAKEIMCIRVLGGASKKYGRVGDTIIASVKQAQPNSGVKKGDVVRIRLIGAGDEMHSIHIHGHDFEVYAKDGRPLANPYLADTILFGPGERYDLILRADNPGIWMVHDHIDKHTVNGTSTSATT